MEPPKSCHSCGRTIEWRRKWKDNWDEVRYCSSACRRQKPSALDTRIEQTIVELLESRATSSTICPSEAARVLFPGDDWRSQMERTRRAARRLVSEGRLEIMQRGRAVDPSTAKGPIRLKLKS
ncbi:DUF2256 and DUF3253 domain-containing protein [Haloferula rosea]|uniref:DUF2256 and DUF3253 domain-containing protein n=1 Tax=Haloferula rosea TaxID=490093 RepID=A0A934RG69_9BACT|nr:DUF2256 and DUF3253 domain-containing protein [Haloferula rosea]MBK1827946.1 DUF2256 and DUF3253 domain-containing protein [Haloferula rosea]